PGQPLAGAQCNVEFDPSLLMVTDVSDGGMFGMWFDALLEIDNTNGVVENIIAINLGGTTSTSGTLAVIEFEAKTSVGTSDINLDNVEISDQYGNPVAYSVTNGSVTVTSETPILSRSPASHDFGDMLVDHTASTTFEIWNSGEGTLTYSLSESCGWVSVSPVSGTSTGEHDTVTVTVDTTGLSLGSHSCTVSISSDGGSSTFTVTVNVTDADLVSPTIANILATPATQEAGNMVRLSARVTDNVGVGNVYLVVEYPNGSLYNISITGYKTGSTYYYEYTYPLLGTYNFSFYAVDTSGNGKTSATQSFVIEDTTPPVIDDISATPNPVAYGGTINISATVTDFMGIAAVHLEITHPDDSVDNVTVTGNLAGESTYYYRHSFDELGTYEYAFYAVDTTGNGYTSPLRTFTVQDKTPPQVEVVYPDGGEYVSGKVLVEWNVTDNYDDPEDLTVTLKYSADNGASWQNIASDLDNLGEYEWDTTGLADGTRYRVKVNVYDTTGNMGTDISDASFTVDNTAPSLSLQKPTPGTLYMFDREVMPLLLRDKAVIVGAITVIVEASDAMSGVRNVEFMVDGGSKFVDSSTPYEWEWDETAFGAHTLTVVVTDRAGNTARETVEVKVYNI
ncbi:MAG: Ig-like domain-containing protein, partial [Candidatus Thermoplasmatota archaeon]|nr:Ig-like domain-containing protein [Candidatus Thermoplasmatota archaeon]